MGTTRQHCLHLADALVRRLAGGVAPSPTSPVSSGDPDAPRSSVVTVDFRRAGRLRLPSEPPPYGAKVLAFTRPQAVIVAHPSAAR